MSLSRYLKRIGGYLRGTHQGHQTWCLLGGEQSSRGWGEVGGDGRGNPLPKGQGDVDGGVVGIGRERPLALHLHYEKPPGPGTKVLKA